MPFLSLIIPTMRAGGVDFLLQSLAAQTFKDFELVLVDGLRDWRAAEVADYARAIGVAVMHVAPSPNPFPNVAFCKYANTGLIHARGEVAVFMVDYSRLPPDLLSRHAAFHAADVSRKRGLMCPHRYARLAVNARWPGYRRENADAYERDLKSGRLDAFKLSTGTATYENAESFGVDGGGVATWDADPKLRLAPGPIAPEYFHSKNESVRLEHALAINGWDEDLDGAHVYQDTDFACRLSAKADVTWTVDPAGVVDIVNPRGVFPFARRTRDYRENERIWTSKRDAGYPNPNSYSLVEERKRIMNQQDIKIAQVRTNARLGFKFAETSGMIHDHASWWTFDDEQAVRDRHWHIKPGDVVFDIGAAFGSYALPALALGGTVYAFNPSDFDSSLCALNVSLNPDLAPRFHQFRDGFGSRDCWFDPDKSVFADQRGEGPAWLRVRALDSWMADHPEITRLDWIKMDIEGAELEALKGAEQTLRRFKPKLLIENHQFHHKTMEMDVQRFLVGLGLGYVCDGPYPYHMISHSFFEVRK